MFKFTSKFILALATCAIAGMLPAAEFFNEEGTGLSDSEMEQLRQEHGSVFASTGEENIVIDDMVFPAESMITSGFSGRRWPNGEIFYQFDANVSAANRARFLEACKVWENVADVKCSLRSNEPNFIHVSGSQFNRAHVGMIGGQQIFEMFNWQSKFIIAHELGHTLGLSHEQSRSRRDDFVIILEGNIRAGAHRNFNKRNTINHTPYDFRSIMHYGPNAFSKNGGPTIIPKEGFEHEARHMGNRFYLSAQDAAGMASQYGARK